MTKQFEVWLADLNPRFGTESGKIRPVVVVQTDLLNQVHPSTLICPITTNVVETATLLRVNVAAGAAGLEKDSSVMVDQLRAIDNVRLLQRLGALPDDISEQLRQNLKALLDLP